VQKAEYVYLPPTRIAYLLPALALHKLAHLPVLAALRTVSALSSCLFMLAAFAFAFRWLNRRSALAVLAILACAPLQIHMAQYAFVDDVAGLAALFSVACFWEGIQGRKKWIPAFGVSFLFLLLAKQETAVFVGIYFGVMLIASGWMKFGRIGPAHVAAFLLAPVASILILALLAGGFGTLFGVFQIYSRLSMSLPYTLATGGGPWHRYLVEHLFVNPLVFLPATGFAICKACNTKLNTSLLLFFAVTYAVMCSIPHGMNLRHTVMWDFPLTIFAAQCLDLMAARLRRPAIALAVLTVVVCMAELRQYETVFVKLYDTDPKFMFRNVEMISN